MGVAAWEMDTKEGEPDIQKGGQSDTNSPVELLKSIEGIVTTPGCPGYSEEGWR